MRRATKKVIEAAADMLNTVACGSCLTWRDMADRLGVGMDAIDLAWDTVREVDEVALFGTSLKWQYLWADAEARLRTGWLPPGWS